MEFVDTSKMSRVTEDDFKEYVADYPDHLHPKTANCGALDVWVSHSGSDIIAARTKDGKFFIDIEASA